MKSREISIVHIIPTNKIGGVEIAACSSEDILSKFFSFRIEFVFNYHKYNFFKKVKGVIKLIFKLIADPPDIVITSLWLSVLVAFPLNFFYKRKIIWIHFIHNTTFFHFLDWCFNKIAIKNCKYIFVDSDSSKEFIKKYTNKETHKISFILDQNIVKKNKEINLDLIKILFVGRISKQKNLPLALEIVRRLVSQGYKVRFDIFGPVEMDIEDLNFYIRKFNISNNVSFKGSCTNSELDNLMYDYDFYLQTSDNEGMSMSVVQAMQRGLVCLVTPKGEIKNYSVDMFSAVHLNSSKEYDIENFIFNIEKCISDPITYKFISKNAYEYFKNEPTYSESILRTILNITSLINSN